MPFWKIYHTPDVFTDETDKAAIAKGATEFYRSVGLPEFYVHVLFIPIKQEDSFTGGGLQSRFVIIEISHIARNYNGNKDKANSLKANFDRIMMPFTTEKGIHLEYLVMEGPAALWRIDGVDPPEAFGQDEQEQAEVNRKILAEKYPKRF